MVSYDVIYLFTSVSVDLALEVVSKKLQNEDDLPNRTDLSVQNIIKLLEFVLKNSFFINENQFYQQIFGCAMGSPVSAIIANLMMQFIEEKALLTTHVRPKWWYRFVDDSHSCLHKQELQRFLTLLNSINPNIQFTMEIEEDGCLPFLDTLTKRESNRIAVEVYQKPTHTNILISIHVTQNSINVPLSEHSYIELRKFHHRRQPKLRRLYIPEKS